MEGKQKIFYALGQLAYVVALADGKIQPEEKQKLHAIIAEEAKDHDPDYDFSDIIFDLLDDEKMDQETIFEAAFKEIKSASYYLTDDMKSDFPAILEKVARAKSPITDNEIKWLKRIKTELEKI